MVLLCGAASVSTAVVHAPASGRLSDDSRSVVTRSVDKTVSGPGGKAFLFLYFSNIPIATPSFPPITLDCFATEFKVN